MAMSPATFSANILQGFTIAGFVGTGTPAFANAVGNGAMAEIIGKPFNTLDIGTAPGTGLGVGVGLTGIVGAVVSAQIQTEIITTVPASPTPDLAAMADAIGNALETEVLLATLSTNHAPIFAGTATIIPGSIAVIGSALGASIAQLGQIAGFVGTDWPPIAKAIGNGIASAFALANSAITITPSSTTPPVAPLPPTPNTIIPAGVLA